MKATTTASAAAQPQTEDYNMTTDEVAACMRIGNRRVREYAKTGELRSIRLGYRTIRFRRTDVDAFLAQHASR